MQFAEDVVSRWVTEEGDWHLMKKLLMVAFAVMALSACTPEEISAWLAVQEAQEASVPVIGATDRAAALSLPATGHTEVVWGETVHVVAWVGEDGEARGHFVYDGEGGRWLVQLNSEPAHAYVWRVTADPCVADPFGQVIYDPQVCGAIPASVPVP